MLSFRTAGAHDLDWVFDTDPIGRSDARRNGFLQRGVDDGRCELAVDGETRLGFAIWHRHFFSRPFLALLMVAPDARRRGVGSALVEHVAGTLAFRRSILHVDQCLERGSAASLCAPGIPPLRHDRGDRSRRSRVDLRTGPRAVLVGRGRERRLRCALPVDPRRTLIPAPVGGDDHARPTRRFGKPCLPEAPAAGREFAGSGAARRRPRRLRWRRRGR